MQKLLQIISLAMILYACPSFAEEKTNHHQAPIARFHLALDMSDKFVPESEDVPLTSEEELGVHVGFNLKLAPVEFTLFTGIDLSLNTPWSDPYSRQAIAGVQVVREIADPIRVALQAAVTWEWYNRENELGQVVSPNTTIPLQTGLDILLLEGKRSDLSFQALGGIAPHRSQREWGLAGICSIALHANL